MHAADRIVAVPSGPALEALIDRYYEVKDRVMGAFFQNPEKPQRWSLVPAKRIKKIWQESATQGVVRDVKGLQTISSRMIDNALKLRINTEAKGHTMVSPADLDERLTDDRLELFADHIIDPASGNWRISDSATDKLLTLAAKLLDTPSPEEQLVVIDRMLQITHPRSDLAALFVEGGSYTLSELSA